MGKRYGRNQKRRARDREAELQKEISKVKKERTAYQHEAAKTKHQLRATLCDYGLYPHVCRMPTAYDRPEVRTFRVTVLPKPLEFRQVLSSHEIMELHSELSRRGIPEIWARGIAAKTAAEFAEALRKEIFEVVEEGLIRSLMDVAHSLI